MKRLIPLLVAAVLVSEVIVHLATRAGLSYWDGLTLAALLALLMGLASGWAARRA